MKNGFNDSLYVLEVCAYQTVLPFAWFVGTPGRKRQRERESESKKSTPSKLPVAPETKCVLIT